MLFSETRSSPKHRLAPIGLAPPATTPSAIIRYARIPACEISIPTRIGSTLRSINRARTIATILARFGFGQFVTGLRLDGVPLVGRILVQKDMADRSIHERARLAIEALGPTFIKLGQIASTRPDLLPQAWIEELKKLQADIPAAPWDEIEPQLEREFPGGIDSVFKSIEHEAFAAASMAQTHRAVLLDGQPVVIKILRPGIRGVIESDMEILALLADFAQGTLKNLGYNPVEVVAQFATQLRLETDLAREARSGQRMGKDLADIEGVSVPRVYLKASTRNMLTMEEIRGRLLSHVDFDELSDESRLTIAQHAADAVFTQCLAIGFFHADPHPGNIFVLEDDAICLIDFGMTGHIDPGTSAALAGLIQGVMTSDLDRVIRIAIALTDAEPSLARHRPFRADVWALLSNFRVESLSELAIGPILTEFFATLRAHNLQCPADLVYLIKAITTIEGVAQQLAPDFDMISHVKPKLEKLVLERYGFAQLRRRVEGTTKDYADLTRDLPGMIRDLTDTIQRGRLDIGLHHEGIEDIEKTLESASVNLSYAVVVAAIFVGSSVLILADSIDRSTGWITALAGAGFGVALVLITARRLSIYIRNR